MGTLGNAWKTLKGGRLDAASHFSIPVRFPAPGAHTVRVMSRGDARNIAAVSDTQTVTVNQKEKPHFAIRTSQPIIAEGGSATTRGVLSKPAATTPEPNVTVTLWGHIYGEPYAPITSTPTGTDGSYRFTVTPQHNEEYQVRTSFAPVRATAQLFEGVADVVTIVSRVRHRPSDSR